MKIHAHFVALLAAAAVLAAAGPALLISDSAEGEWTAAMTAARSHVETGDMFTSGRRFDLARAEYAAAAAAARSVGELPVEAVRRIANAYYFEGDYADARRTLEELAEEADGFGDAIAEAWAMVDAAYIAELSGDEETAKLSRARLEQLLDSGAIEAAERNEIREKLADPFPVFAPHLSTW